MAASAAGSSIRPVPVAVPFGLRAAATPSHQIPAARFPKYSPDSNLRSLSVRATSSAETCVSDPPSQLQPAKSAQPAKPGPAEETPAQNESVEIKETKSKPANLREVVFVTSEAAPWSKTGGLGDVCGSLPGALAARGHRVMVVVPLYQEYEGVTYTGMTIKVHESDIGLYYIKKDGVDWVFLDHPSYKRLGGIYGDKLGDYGDNQWRYMLLCLAALEVPLQLELDGSVYGQNCTFICNDWQAGLVPVYLAAKYRPGGCYRGARTVLAIHNLRYQGVFPPSTFEMLRLPSEWYGALDWQYPPHERQGAYEEEGHCVNTLKAAIGTADRLVTVSPGYAGEIQTPLGGCKMEGLLQARSYALNGVLNGINMDEWDPAQDKHIARNYSLSDFREGKRANKEALQRQLGLPQNGDIPMVVFIGRLDYQKGADLVLSAAPSIMHDGAQMVLLGSGSEDLENGLRWLESSFPNSARCWVGFNVPLSHLMTAGADMLLMPSRFEPCGLNQLYAMRYGTVPIAYSTGGLKDTVIPFNPWTMEGTGWTFSGDCNSDGLVSATKQALETFRAHRQSFEHVQVQGMKRNSSWDDAAAQYEQIFDWANHDEPFSC